MIFCTLLSYSPKRGMRLDCSEAESWLAHVGYYRLSGYWYPYREKSDKLMQRLDTFVTGTNFHDIALLYEFDRKLRDYIFDGIERVEVALRAQLSARLGAYAVGCLWWFYPQVKVLPVIGCSSSAKWDKCIVWIVF
ncbi:Abi family protein [Gardnerella piotii]|uniref:Abi family protein n=1 Tax=Gardnerella piotii TaxID=2792977 RepID=UPI0039EF8B37